MLRCVAVCGGVLHLQMLSVNVSRNQLLHILKSILEHHTQCHQIPPLDDSVLQCVAVCISVLQCVAVCCSVLQGVAARCSVFQCDAAWKDYTRDQPPP